MEILHAILLGVIQGITEFLPISSSGHLALAQALFGYQSTGLVFEVFLHFGTVVSVLVVFRTEIIQIISSLFHGLKQPREWKQLWQTDPQFKMNGLIVIGIIPAGVIGFLAEEYVDRIFQSPALVGAMLIATALILWSSRWPNKEVSGELTTGKSILIGFAQALAIIPGISRSGTTITAGLWSHIEPEQAAKFSFYLAIPVILGASALELTRVFHAHFTAIELWAIAAGTLTSFLAGWVAIIFLMDLLRKGKFSWFAIYCLVIGVLTIALSLL